MPDVRMPKEKEMRVMQGAMIAFAAIFFSEWGDVGMVVAGAMAARFVWAAGVVQTEHLTQTTAATLVWLGAVAAMITKGALAVTLGAGVRRGSPSACRRAW